MNSFISALTMSAMLLALTADAAAAPGPTPPGQPLTPALDWKYSEGAIIPGPPGRMSFGIALALSGDGKIVLIGGKDGAYFYTSGSSGWAQQQSLWGFSVGAAFGSAVALSKDGKTAIVGARDADSKKGAAYVFFRGQSGWSVQQKITGSVTQAGGEFGTSIALSADGETALVGAPLHDSGGLENRGAVYLFSRSGAVWSEVQAIEGSSAKERFGASVAVSADAGIWLVGAAGYDGDQVDAGRAFFFRRSGSTWGSNGRLLQSPQREAFVGASVALSSVGDAALVGAPQNMGKLGHAYAARPSGSTSWSEPWSDQLSARGATVGLLQAPMFGQAVALAADASIAVIGSFGSDGSTGSDQGSAYVFRPMPRDSGGSWGDWPQTQVFHASNASSGAFFGSAVALSQNGGVCAVGAMRAQSNAGAVYIFERQPLVKKVVPANPTP